MSVTQSEEVCLSHQLTEYLPILAQFNSTKLLTRSLTYNSLKKQIDHLMNGFDTGFYAPKPNQHPERPFYRAVGWNIERGMVLEGVLEQLRSNPILNKGDLFFFTETDIGMARTKNKNIAREIAKELGLNYFFGPTYLNLCKGNSIEGHVAGENELGLHGNAFASRYPISNFRAVVLKNCKDKMRGSEKRIGSQTALVCDVHFPNKTVTCVVAHLDAHSSQRQRAGQMEVILKSLDDNPHPVLVGGDLNTCCYNAKHAFYAFWGFWHKVLRGVQHVIPHHYPYPDRYYDRFLFHTFEKHGLEYRSFNETGKGTLHYRVEDIRGNHLVEEVVPEWCRRIMENTLARFGGKVSLKLDWFAGRGIAAAKHPAALAPKVIPDLKYHGKMISDHDPIIFDFE